MKAYTDLEQSKKLTEILPLESADMHYNNSSCRGVDYIEHFSAELMPYQEALYLMKIHKTNFMFQVIPCWSLAALLEFIPNVEIKSKVQNFESKRWCVSSHDDKDYNRIWVYNDELIDACYEMIIKLK